MAALFAGTFTRYPGIRASRAAHLVQGPFVLNVYESREIPEPVRALLLFAVVDGREAHIWAGPSLPLAP